MSRAEIQSDGEIAEFLGKEAAIGGPFAVLGLKYAPMDQALILRACQDRLRRINEHRRSRTPAADEVRLAVHAAASQLLDRELRQELARHWPEGSGAAGVVSESPKAWRIEPSSRLDEGVRQQAMTLLGACGGWNSRSRKRLGQFARMHQISAAQLVEGILGRHEDGGEYRGENGGDDRGAVSQTVRGPSLIDPAAGTLPWVLIPIAYVMMGLLLISTGYMKHLESRDGAVPIREAGSGSDTGTTVAGRGSGQTERGRVSERRHYSAILFELEKIQHAGVSDVEAARAFSEVGQRLGEQWTEFPAGELDRAVEAVGGVLGGILNPEVFGAASAFLNKGDSDHSDPVLLSAIRVWLFGSQIGDDHYSAMARRSAEGSVGGGVGGGVGGFGGFGGVGGVGGVGGFDQYLLTEFVRIAKLSSDDPEWWSWWIGQLEPMEDRVPGFVESRIFDAAYWRLIDGRIGDGWAQIAKQVVQRVEWRDGSEARLWMMGLIVDPSVRSDRLAVLTEAMVVHSSAKGLEVGMVVNAGDSIVQREAYLGLLRERWASEHAAQSGVRLQLIDRIELLLRITQSPTGLRQTMIHGVELARVNSACFAYQGDDEAGVLGLMNIFDSPMSGAGASGRVLDLSSSAGDELWATKARNLSESDQLFEHLRVLDRLDIVGPKSAHALVYLAMQAPDLQVRAGAERVMLLRRGEVPILIALDRVAGATRVTRRMTELIHGYIGYDGDLNDPVSTRRALHESLVSAGMLDGGSSNGEKESYSQGMADSYRLGGLSLSSGGARGYFDELVIGFKADGRVVPSKVRARLLVRLRRSRGPMQVFYAYQSAALELLGEEVMLMEPGSVARVERVMSRTSVKIHQSVDVYVQILLIERAMAELWLIVLESEGVS